MQFINFNKKKYDVYGPFVLKER